MHPNNELPLSEWPRTEPLWEKLGLKEMPTRGVRSQSKRLVLIILNSQQVPHRVAFQYKSERARQRWGWHTYGTRTVRAQNSQGLTLM